MKRVFQVAAMAVISFLLSATALPAQGRDGGYEQQRYQEGGWNRGNYRNSYADRGGSYANRGYDDGYYHRRHAGRSVAIIGGGAAAGAAIGAVGGGGKGAAIGAAIGGVSGLLIDQAVRHHHRDRD